MAPKRISAAELAEQQSVNKRLKIACVLCLTFMSIEIAGGVISKSLAIISDAAHLSTDFLSFAIALLANHLSMKGSSTKFSYGMRRAEVLSAIASISFLVVLTLYLVVEAFVRIHLWTKGEMEAVDGKIMTIIAAIGICVNIALAVVLGENHVHMDGEAEASHSHAHGHGHGEACGGHGDEEAAHHSDHGDHDDHGHSHEHGHSHGHTDPNHEPLDAPLLSSSYGSTDADAGPKSTAKNINMEAAYMHVLGDLIQSVAVMISGIIIWIEPSYQIADPICTVLFSLIVCYSTMGVIKNSVNVLMEGVPKSVKWDVVNRQIQDITGVTNVHDLHIWSISVGKPALSVHLTAANPKAAMLGVGVIGRRNGIEHITVQAQHVTAGAGCLICGADGGCI